MVNSNLSKSPDTPDPDQVNLCKGCNTMKHLDAKGLCGRCQPDPKRTLDKENSYMGDITPDQDGLIEFLDDPETLKKAVEGSMDKRIAKLDQVDALDELLNTYDLSSMRVPARAEAKAKLLALLVDARLDELKKYDALDALTEVMLDMNRYGCPSLIIRPEDGNAWAASITVNLTGKQWDMTTLEEEGDTALEAAQRLSQRLAEIVSQDKSSKNASSEELEKQREAKT